MAEYRAKKAALLDTLKQELNKGFIEKEFEVRGHKFKLRTLSEDDEVWADGFLRTNTTAAIISSRRTPRLACSIVSIDGQLKDQLFLIPDDMPEGAKIALKENAIQMKYWLNDSMLYFLLEDSYRPFITDLWSKYEELDKAREEATANLPNS